ncbi:hypothetical protein [Methylobacterium isbiliense]|jgi:hypothetical protein|uniref:Uncharacterized protein n=1 Tax=Methylobacterium isbiliense TaxID=315478 RepID=A0ABQ4SEG1_9HYPH|nr:hypothetical protein [Methylobacterium isbiliense]MDN3621563.1 hypothetical protein [Methylobacterium isbiliense]GJE00793.1 hypothetical protein GMJLKIPL_2719 [Methylobacterium isbiliense]
MDEREAFGPLSGEEICAGLAAIAQAAARQSTPHRTIRASLAPDGIAVEGFRGTSRLDGFVIPLRDLARRPGYLLAHEVERFAGRV